MKSIPEKAISVKNRQFSRSRCVANFIGDSTLWRSQSEGGLGFDAFGNCPDRFIAYVKPLQRWGANGKNSSTVALVVAMMTGQNSVVPRGFPIMSSILKFFRITFFLVLYFFLCMVVVTTMLQVWPVGAQMLFAFGVPVILIWWQEKRRSRKVATKAQAEGSSETRTSRPEPVSRPRGYENRIERERERIREANASKATGCRSCLFPTKAGLR